MTDTTHRDHLVTTRRDRLLKPALGITGVILSSIGVAVAIGFFPQCGSYQTVSNAKEQHLLLEKKFVDEQKRNDKEHERMYQSIQQTLNRMEKNEEKHREQFEKISERTWQIYKEVRRR